MLLFFICVCSALAQDNKLIINQAIHSISGYSGYGVFLPHREIMKALPIDYPYIIGIEILFNQDTSKQWALFYRNLRVGIIGHFQTTGNSKVLGYGAGVSPIFSFFYHNFEVFFGAGIGFLSKKWKRTENYKNVSIGSNLNVLFVANFTYRFIKVNRFAFSVFSTFSHFSNMALAMPNTGINYLFMGLKVNFLQNTSPPHTKYHNITLLSKKFYLFSIGFGVRAIKPIPPNRYPVFNVEFSKIIWSTSKGALNIMPSLDIFYNVANYYEAYDKNIIPNSKFFFQGGTSLNFLWVLTKIWITTGWGYYVYSPGRIYGNYYHKVGIRCILFKKLMLNNVLIANFFKANFLAVGLGMLF